MSFVLLVIKDAVENWLNSAFEKDKILSNTLSLIVLPNFAATRDENIIIKTAQTILINAIPSIDNPVLAIYLLLIFPVSIPIA